MYYAKFGIGEPLRDLKFRQVKAYAKINGKFEWVIVNRLVANPITDRASLLSALIELDRLQTKCTKRRK